MHWGWQSGYRFVCMEGKAGSALDKAYEVHALGDNNYKIQQITTTGLPQGSDLAVSLTADYAKALEGVDINSGSIRHGTSGEAVDLLDNFALKVFTSHEGNGSVLSAEHSVLEKSPKSIPTLRRHPEHRSSGPMGMAAFRPHRKGSTIRRMRPSAGWATQPEHPRIRGLSFPID